MDPSLMVRERSWGCQNNFFLTHLCLWRMTVCEKCAAYIQIISSLSEISSWRCSSEVCLDIFLVVNAMTMSLFCFVSLIMNGHHLSYITAVFKTNNKQKFAMTIKCWTLLTSLCLIKFWFKGIGKHKMML